MIKYVFNLVAIPFFKDVHLVHNQSIAETISTVFPSMMTVSEESNVMRVNILKVRYYGLFSQQELR